MNQLIALFSGTGLLVLSFLFRQGMWKDRWVPKRKKDLAGPSSLFFDERGILIFLPSLGLFFLSAGCAQLATLPGGLVSSILLTLCFIVSIGSFGGIFWGLFSVYFPAGIRPLWLQEHYRKIGGAPARGKIFAPAWYRQELQRKS